MGVHPGSTLLCVTAVLLGSISHNKDSHHISLTPQLAFGNGACVSGTEHRGAYLDVILEGP